MISATDMKLKTKLMLLTATSLAALIVVGVISYSSLQKVRIGGPIANHIRVDLKLANDMLPPPLNIIRTRIVVYQLLRETDKARLQQEIADFQRLKQEYLESHEKWAKALPEGKVKELVIVKAHEPAMAYQQMVEQELIPALIRGDKKKAEALVPRLISHYAAHSAAIDEANRLNYENLHESEAQGAAAARSALIMLIVTGFLVAVLVSGLGILIVRSI